jgi:predicted transcriptional regulator
MSIVDALVFADPETLQEVGDPIRDALAKLFNGAGHTREARGYLLAVLAMARLGLERLPDPHAVRLHPESHAASALAALADGGPLTNQELRDRLQTSASQLSRVGRQLLADGLVVQRRAGRTASWEITPRGRQAVHHKKSARRAGTR